MARPKGGTLPKCQNFQSEPIFIKNVVQARNYKLLLEIEKKIKNLKFSKFSRRDPKIEKKSK